MKRKTIIFLLFLILMFLIIQMLRYQPGTYVCRHMARDQEIVLENIGFDVKIVRGDDKFSDEGHAWVALNLNGFLLHIDSVGWYPFIPELLFENIETFDSYEEYKNH